MFLQSQLKDFDSLTAQLIAAAEKDIQPMMEVEHIHERLNLREKQLKELAEVTSYQKLNYSYPKFSSRGTPCLGRWTGNYSKGSTDYDWRNTFLDIDIRVF